MGFVAIGADSFVFYDGVPRGQMQLAAYLRVAGNAGRHLIATLQDRVTQFMAAMTAGATEPGMLMHRSLPMAQARFMAAQALLILFIRAGT